MAKKARIHRDAIVGAALALLCVVSANPVFAASWQGRQGKETLPWKEVLDLSEVVRAPSFMEWLFDLLAAILQMPGAFLDLLLW